MLNLVDIDQNYQFVNADAESHGPTEQSQSFYNNNYGNYEAEVIHEANFGANVEANRWNGDDLPVAAEVELQNDQEFNFEVFEDIFNLY